jgi:hypothetical protein
MSAMPPAQPDTVTEDRGWLAGMSPSRYALIVAAILALLAIILLMMGREPFCTCGTVKLWHGSIFSSENSQHVLDWYSFTHIAHGFGLYLFVWLLFPNASIGKRLVLAVAIEAGWEILENSNFIIDRYRAGTISLNYYGDSIVNSLADVAMMIFGFLLAARLPVWGTIAIAVAMELALGVLIRDNLTLNVIMLIHSFEGIRTWQSTPLLR